MEPQKIKNKFENPAKGLNLAAGLLANTGQAAPHKEDNGSIKENKVETPDTSWTHFTVICSVELVEKVKAIAQREDFSIREVVEKFFTNGINAYEAKHKVKLKIKPKKKRNIDDLI